MARGRKADRSVGEPVTSDREPVNKRRSARKFVQAARRTKVPNMAGSPMRGGIRM